MRASILSVEACASSGAHIIGSRSDLRVDREAAGTQRSLSLSRGTLDPTPFPPRALRRRAQAPIPFFGRPGDRLAPHMRPTAAMRLLTACGHDVLCGKSSMKRPSAPGERILASCWATTVMHLLPTLRARCSRCRRRRSPRALRRRRLRPPVPSSTRPPEFEVEQRASRPPRGCW